MISLFEYITKFGEESQKTDIKFKILNSEDTSELNLLYAKLIENVKRRKLLDDLFISQVVNFIEASYDDFLLYVENIK